MGFELIILMGSYVEIFVEKLERPSLDLESFRQIAEKCKVLSLKIGW